jgi:hypothetical protein
MSFQLTFLGYYPIKSPQLKKQTHSVKRRNWSHRERTAQANGPRWTAPDGRRRRTASSGRQLRTGQPSASVGRPWRTAPAAGHPFRQSEGGRPPPSVGRGGRQMADGLTVRQADVRGIVGRVRTSGGRSRGCPDA